MAARTSSHRRSNECGTFTVKVTPRGTSASCPHGKDPVEVRIGKWSPGVVCLGARYDGHTARGRAEAANMAADVYEHAGCDARPLSGRRRRRRR